MLSRPLLSRGSSCNVIEPNMKDVKEMNTFTNIYKQILCK